MNVTRVLPLAHVELIALLVGACSQKSSSVPETGHPGDATADAAAPAAEEQTAAPIQDGSRLPENIRQALLAMNAELPARADQAVSFELADLDGNLTSLASYRGKVVLLNFWATWCVPCVTEMPSMERLYRQLRDDGFAMVGIDLMEDPKTVANFVRDRVNVSYDILIDESGGVTRTYAATSLPTSYLIDRSGRIVGRIIGARDWDRDEVVTAVRALLESEPPEAARSTASGLEGVPG